MQHQCSVFPDGIDGHVLKPRFTTACTGVSGMVKINHLEAFSPDLMNRRSSAKFCDQLGIIMGVHHCIVAKDIIQRPQRQLFPVVEVQKKHFITIAGLIQPLVHGLVCQHQRE